MRHDNDDVMARLLEYKRLAEEGKTLQEIGELYGISRQAVYSSLQGKRAKELGIGELRKETTRARLQKERYTRALERERTNRANSISKFGVDMSREEFAQDVLRKVQHERLLTKKRNNTSRGAKKVEFSVVWADVEWPTHCPVLGVELDYFCESGRKSENSASFDRLDPTQGYVKGNVRVISWRANRIKNDGTAEEHRKIADWMEAQVFTSSD